MDQHLYLIVYTGEGIHIAFIAVWGKLVIDIQQLRSLPPHGPAFRRCRRLRRPVKDLWISHG